MVSPEGLRSVLSWGPSLDVLAGPGLQSSSWVHGLCTHTAFTPMAETELLNQQKVPAHFVALDGNKLNISLRTGPEVRDQ